MRPRRTAPVLVAIIAAVLLVTGCGGRDGTGKPKSSPSVTAASATPTKPVWAAKYTDKQYADFLAALARYKDYLAHDQAWLNSDPKAAVPMVKEYFTPKEGAFQLKLIKYADDHKARADNNPRMLWAKMTRYGETIQGQAQVTMAQCMDGRVDRDYQYGKRLKGPGVKTPLIYTITMGRTPRGKWMIARIINPGTDMVKPVACGV